MKRIFAAIAVTALCLTVVGSAHATIVFGPATQRYISSTGDIGVTHLNLMDDTTFTNTWRAVATLGTYSGTGNAGARPYTASAYYIHPSVGEYFPAGKSGLFFQAREDVGGVPMSKGLVGTNIFGGVKMSDITKLSYWTSYPRASFVYTNEIPASIELWLTDGANIRFVEWQPNHSLVNLGQVMVDGVNRWRWNQWNVMDETQGKFHVYADGANVLTLSQFQAAYGGWAFMSSVPYGDDINTNTNLVGSSFVFQMGEPRLQQAGMGNSGDSTWYQNQIATSIVDNLEISFGGTDYQYNFEIVPEPGSMLALGTGLLGMAGLLRRSRKS